MTQEKFGVGVIGLGVGEQHVAAFGRHPECRLVAICDKDEARLLSVGSRVPAARQYASADALIDDPDVDIVAVASYDHDHAAQILRALEAGRHVFAEKPMCTSQSAAADIHAALRRKPHLRMSSNTILRMSERFRALKIRIDNGDLGNLFFAEADYNYGRLQKLTEGWRGLDPNYSVTLGGGIHVVDLLLWLTGKRVVEVTGFGNPIARSKAGGHFAGNDLTVALLHFDDGMIGKVAANFGCVYPHFHRLVIYGTEATYENGLPDARLYRSRDPKVPPEAITDTYPGVGKGDLIPSFIDAIRQRGEPIVGENDVFSALSVCFAIDNAIASSKRLAVEYV